VTVFAMKPGTDDGSRAPEWLANRRYTDVQTSGLTAQVTDAPAAGAYDYDLQP
jgi:hypothetical protein